ncbi:hypothetical protein HI914_05705 [Erysiphe necator]|uniref:Uncharacterized protein n=1 Tax=Uncinula necator TaxID=52586 RepID=A0A0B1P7Y6_UNCNE|nr:hypothetical protein HI914_05705 [Erysiphe necator]KHJ34353.1 hypothetical protein EV44_g3406 [Erysiphe necator]
MSTIRVPSFTDSTQSIVLFSSSEEFKSARSSVQSYDSRIIASLKNLPNDPMDTSQDEAQNQPTIPTLSAQQIVQLLSLLNVEEKPKPKIREPSANNNAKLSKWPEWHGLEGTYSTYIDL